MNLENISKQVAALSSNVVAYLREENRLLDKSKIESKGENDFVTYVDKESEKKLIVGLSLIFPQAGFLTEEGSVDFHNEEYYWVIDPIDGTTNFIHQLSPYCISIALMQKNKNLLGCVYEVCMDETFYAWKDGGAFLNGNSIRVSETTKLNGALIGHGIPYRLEKKYEYMREKVFQFYGKSTLRHLGSAAAEICYVAAGRLDAYFHDNLSPWDVAGAGIILSEAGGKITDFSDEDNYVFGRELIATNALIHEELISFLETRD